MSNENYEDSKNVAIKSLRSLKAADDRYGIWLLKIINADPELQRSFGNAELTTIAHHTYKEMKKKYGENVPITLNLKREYAELQEENKRQRKMYQDMEQPIPDEYKESPTPVVHPIYSLFDIELVSDILKNMNQENDKNLKIDLERYRKGIGAQCVKEIAQRRAVQLLQEYLEQVQALGSTHPIYEDTYMESERSWCAVLVCHLLQPLTDSRVIIDNDKGKCECPSCKKKIRYGDTSLGDLNLWHGSPDALLPNVGIILPHPQPVTDYERTSSYVDNLYMKMLEIKKLPEIPAPVRKQTLAQSVTFSCIKRDDGRVSNLIPNVLICGHDVKIFMYDAYYDLLMESTKLSLIDLETKQLNSNTILILWLALHWNLFCTGPTFLMIEQDFFADFHSLTKKKDCYDKYIGRNSDMYITGRGKATTSEHSLDSPPKVKIFKGECETTLRPLYKRKLSMGSTSDDASSKSYKMHPDCNNIV